MKTLTGDMIYHIGTDAIGSNEPLFDVYLVDGLGMYRVPISSDKSAAIKEIDKQTKDLLKELGETNE